MDPRVQAALERAMANAARADQTATGGTGPLTPDPGMGALGMDVLQSGLSSGRNVLESTAGTLGDLSNLRYDLADMIAEMGPLDLTEGVQRARETATGFPTTEQVRGFTDAAQAKLPVSADALLKDYTRHKPTTPFGEATGFGVEQVFDPLNLIGGAGVFNKARKVL